MGTCGCATAEGTSAEAERVYAVMPWLRPAADKADGGKTPSPCGTDDRRLPWQLGSLHRSPRFQVHLSARHRQGTALPDLPRGNSSDAVGDDIGLGLACTYRVEGGRIVGPA